MIQIASSQLLELAQQHFHASRFADAETVFAQVLQREPRNVAALQMLGVLAGRKGNLESAEGFFQLALSEAPDNPVLHNNLGSVFKLQGNPDGAMDCFLRAVSLNPSYAMGHSSLATALKERGQIEQAILHYRQTIALAPNNPAWHSHLILALNCDPQATRESLFREAAIWNRQHAAAWSHGTRPAIVDPNPDRQLRIGFLSADFRMHPCAFALAPAMGNFNRAAVAIFAYANVSDPDAVTALMQSRADHWVFTHLLSDDALADRIRSDRIDILLDLNLHTEGNRLLVMARRPAPIQATWLGYPGTTGLSAIDFRITDSCLDPGPDADAFSSEIPLRLPGSFWCYDPLTESPFVNPLPALAARKITLGCLNDFCKINDQTLRTWSALLQKLEGADLLILAPRGAARVRIAEFFAAGGLDSGRIRFVPRVSRPEYLAYYHQIDIALDTFPYNGHITTLDALWMGVPVVTLEGDLHFSRAAASFLRCLGHGEWVAATPHQYVEAAMELCANPARLEHWRQRLRGELRASPLMDGRRMARDLEAAFRDIWRQRCSQQSAVPGFKHREEQ